MRLIVDRFEGNFAICEAEDKTMVNIDRSRLPLTVKEGDIVIETNTGFVIDKNETDKRRERISKLMKDLWE